MRKTSFAAFALIVLAAAVGPVRGQDRPAPPVLSLEELLRKSKSRVTSDIMRWIESCIVYGRQKPTAPDRLAICLSLCAPDDRQCEVWTKMHGQAGDDIERLRTKIRGSSN